DLGQHWQAFLGAVFLVAGEQDDVLALAGAVLAFVDDPVVGAGGSSGDYDAEQRRQAVTQAHGGVPYGCGGYGGCWGLCYVAPCGLGRRRMDCIARAHTHNCPATHTCLGHPLPTEVMLTSP